MSLTPTSLVPTVCRISCEHATSSSPQTNMLNLSRVSVSLATYGIARGAFEGTSLSTASRKTPKAATTRSVFWRCGGIICASSRPACDLDRRIIAPSAWRRSRSSEALNTTCEFVLLSPFLAASASRLRSSSSSRRPMALRSCSSHSDRGRSWTSQGKCFHGASSGKRRWDATARCEHLPRSHSFPSCSLASASRSRRRKARSAALSFSSACARTFLFSAWVAHT
mmetsp:Transcript_14111/g.32184  ORF Transcript_14111/g.32184 Transcript_14111/m.32184 type:complete len:225 (+) Transcript_14111:323-997(+)